MIGLLKVVEFLVVMAIPFGLGIWASRRAERVRNDLGRWQ